MKNPRIKRLLVLPLMLLSFCCRAAVINITAAPYNASTASADNAAAIQAAIAAAAAGDTVLVPAGTFLSGPITLKSNLNFQVAAGAVLRMTAFGTFPQNTNFIYGKNLTSISITGAGTIDGQGAAWWADFNAGNPDNRPPAMIMLSGCTSVTLTGVSVIDSPKFHVQLLGAGSKLYVSGLTITAAWPSPNTDGIDLRGKDVLIENCYISDGDDVIQLGGSSDPVDGVIIRNCAFGTGHGLSIGGYTQAGVKNVLVDNCSFNGTQYGIRWKTGRDRGGIINNLTYSNITMNGILLYPFFLTSFYPNPSSLPPTADDWVTPTATTPYWSNITLRNITASTAASGAKSPGILWASSESPIVNFLMDNVSVTGPAGKNFEIHHARGVTVTCTCRVDGLQPPLNFGAFDAPVYYPACGTATMTKTPSSVQSSTVTPSRTRTMTPVIPTMTFTGTFSRTATVVTPTATFTATATRTATIPTATFTATGTRTATVVIPTATFTATGTRTATVVIPTATFTATGTRTATVVIPTATFTATATRTTTAVIPSATFTATATSTAIVVIPTASFTGTGTRTATAVIPTATFTATGTRTATVVIPTATFTATGTRTATVVIPTATFTATGTRTATVVIPTATFTATGTRTATVVISTATFTDTVTDTATAVIQTATQTMTSIVQSATAAVSPSATASVSPTNSNTRTPTFSNTITRTSTFTPENTSTRTVTPGVMATLTLTLTSNQTFTASATMTASAVMTSTASATASVSPQNTNTRTPTNTATQPAATFTRTASFTVTTTSNPIFTPTNTPTIAPTAAVFSVEALVYPNPYNPATGDLKIGFSSTRPVESVSYSIYTASFRRILFEAGIAPAAVISVPQRKLAAFASGTYYLVVRADAGQGARASSQAQELIILK